jgi:hypothetical protein
VEEYVDIRQEHTVTALVLLSSLASSLISRGLDPHHTTTALFPIIPSIMSSSESHHHADHQLSSSSSTPVSLLALHPNMRNGLPTNVPWQCFWIALLIGLLSGCVVALFSEFIIRLRYVMCIHQTVFPDRLIGVPVGLVTGAIGGLVFWVTSFAGVWGQGSNTLQEIIDRITRTNTHVVEGY